MTRTRATSIELERRLVELYLEGQLDGPKRVHDLLVAEGFIGIDENGDFSVSEKTIARRMHELSKRDSSSAWSFLDADPDEARLVLDVVLAVARWTDGRGKISKSMAAEIARVRRAAPALDATETYALAWGYQTARARGLEDTRFLDLRLAFSSQQAGLDMVDQHREGIRDIALRERMVRSSNPDEEQARLMEHVGWVGVWAATRLGELDVHVESFLDGLPGDRGAEVADQFWPDLGRPSQRRDPLQKTLSNSPQVIESYLGLFDSKLTAEPKD